MKNRSFLSASVLCAGLLCNTAMVLSATTEIITVNNAGEVGDFGSTYYDRDPAISGAGRFALFLAEGDLLFPDGVDDNGVDDIYLRDLVTGTTELVSVANDGTLGNDHSEEGSMCSEARRVTFASRATNLTADELSAGSHIFVRDRVAGTTSLVSPPDTWAYLAHISDNCRYVTYQGSGNTYITDLETGASISVPMPSIESDIGDFYVYMYPRHPSLSADGRYLTFIAQTHVAVPSTNSSYWRRDVFLYDRDADGNGTFDEEGDTTTTLITDQRYDKTTVPEDWNSVSSRYNNISRDGRFVIYCSGFPDLVEDDTNGFIDTFVYDAASGTNVMISRAMNGEPGNADSEAWWTTSLSADGRYAAFSSEASNLVREDIELPDARNGAHDSFLLDRDTDGDGIYDEPGATALEMITVDSNGQQQGGGWDPMVTDDGTKVVFGSFESYVAIDGNDTNDGYLRDRSIPVIEITQAKYKTKRNSLKVKALSDIGPLGDLGLEGYGPMVYKGGGLWQLTVDNLDNPPGSVTVSGPKAYVSIPVDVK